MRKNINTFIKDFSEINLISQPIYEMGSLIVPGQEHLSIRNYFKHLQYIGIDFRHGNGVDAIGDIENLDTIKSESAGLIICCDTLEHVKNPIKAVNEMKRILKRDGVIIITSVMDFPIHDYPHDYWRFTPECFAMLLEGFAYVNVQWSGKRSKPHTVVGIATNGSVIVPILQQDSFVKRLYNYVVPPVVGYVYKRLVKQ